MKWLEYGQFDPLILSVKNKFMAVASGTKKKIRQNGEILLTD